MCCRFYAMNAWKKGNNTDGFSSEEHGITGKGGAIARIKEFYTFGPDMDVFSAGWD